jgi:hypothetical protein
MVSPSSDSKANSPRKPISRRLRYEILRRDDNTCRYCHATDSPLTIDHVVPVALGGTDEPSNLVACCKDCNAGKTSTNPSAAVVEQATNDALRWSAAMQVAAGLAMDEVDRVNVYISTIDATWDRWEGDATIYRPGDWSRSARHWYAAGLPVALVVDAIDLAMGNRQVVHTDVWRYACGIVWKRIEKLREDASRVIAEGAV